MPPPGRTRDALGPQLPGWLSTFGASPPSVVRLPDRLADLTAALATSRADLVITTGGTSVGPRDHVRAAVAGAGGRVVVDGVHVKPGHPMLLAALPGGRWLVGLPGNPFAACAALLTLVRPLLDGMHGLGRAATETAVLATAEPARPGDGHRCCRSGATEVGSPSYCRRAVRRCCAVWPRRPVWLSSRRPARPRVTSWSTYRFPGSSWWMLKDGTSDGGCRWTEASLSP